MNEAPKLTDRQQQILSLIQITIERKGSPPTRAEIANELGFKSANAAEEHLLRPADVVFVGQRRRIEREQRHLVAERDQPRRQRIVAQAAAAIH